MRNFFSACPLAFTYGLPVQRESGLTDCIVFLLRPVFTEGGAYPIWLVDRTNPAISPARNGFRALSPCTQPTLAIFFKKVLFALWLRGPDSNRRVPGNEPGELPSALPRVILCSARLELASLHRFANKRLYPTLPKSAFRKYSSVPSRHPNSVLRYSYRCHFATNETFEVSLSDLAGDKGFEPLTGRLTAVCSSG